ncbi:MAG: hypothetical protein GX605_02060 [Chloroflexi bacterium]|nr:hypothetical protein [Chloroflexota bacterium]
MSDRSLGSTLWGTPYRCGRLRQTVGPANLVVAPLAAPPSAAPAAAQAGEPDSIAFVSGPAFAVGPKPHQAAAAAYNGDGTFGCAIDIPVGE